MIQWFCFYNPFQTIISITSIRNGIIGDEAVNFYLALELGSFCIARNLNENVLMTFIPETKTQLQTILI